MNTLVILLHSVILQLGAKTNVAEVIVLLFLFLPCFRLHLKPDLIQEIQPSHILAVHESVFICNTIKPYIVFLNGNTSA